MHKSRDLAPNPLHTVIWLLSQLIFQGGRKLYFVSKCKTDIGFKWQSLPVLECYALLGDNFHDPVVLKDIITFAVL